MGEIANDIIYGNSSINTNSMTEQQLTDALNLALEPISLAHQEYLAKNNGSS